MGKHRTYEEVLNAAKQYKTRMEFKNNDMANYSCAVRYGWLNKVCSHMEAVGDMYKRCVYVYELPNKVCYIGLTYDINKRHKEHCDGVTTSVGKYCVEKNINIPLPNKLTNYLDKNKASLLEGIFLEKYKNDGWSVLNKVKTGGLGGSRKKLKNKIVNIGLCKEIAMECDTPTEFQKKYYSLYRIAKQRNWLEYIFSHFDKEEIKRRANIIIKEKNRGKKVDILKCREAAINAKLNKIVEQYDLNGNFLNEYISQEEAARKLGKPKSNGNIGKCCKGKLKTCLGFIWRYKNN